MLDKEVDRLSKLPDDVLLKIVERLDITCIARTVCQTGLGKSSLDMLDKEFDRLSKLPDDVLFKIVERLDITDVARTGCQIGLGESHPHMLDNEVPNDVLLKIVERLPNDVLLKIVELLDITDVTQTGCQIGLCKSSVDMLVNEVDRLSNLPDDILLNIIERLDFTDVARTAILSKRWKQVPAMLSKIIIAVGSFEPKHGRKKLTSHDIERANTTVLEATRSILESRTGSLYIIHLMSMQFYLGDNSIFIGQAVANTIATQKVASVEFIILTEMGIKCTYNDMLTYGRQFMSFFDSCPNVFGGLAHLWLQNLRLRESYFPKIFGICKQLEFLQLYRCDTGHLSLLEVEHQQLRELRIFSSSLKRVDLKWVPKLTVVKFNGFLSPVDPFCLGYVPLLQTVSIINTGLSEQKMLKLSELLDKTAISSLHLDFRSEKIWVKPEGRRQLLPVFHKLRLAELFNISEECDLTWTMFILQGAPTLKKLCIMVRDHLCEMIKGKRRYMYAFSEEKDKGLEWEPSAPDFKHHNLAELRIYGFQAEGKFVRYARNVMEAAVNLEAVYLHKNPGCEKCKPSLPNDWMSTEMLLIREKINKGMSSQVKIHFPRRGREY